MAASSSRLGLRWHDHSMALQSLARDLCGSDELTDVTLTCAGGISFRAHRLVLAGASSYFRSLFSVAVETWKHPVVFLKDVQPDDMEYFLQFIYYGEVNVPSEELDNLVKVAKDLGIKGLDEVADKPEEEEKEERQRGAKRSFPAANRDAHVAKRGRPCSSRAVRSIPPEEQDQYRIKREQEMDVTEEEVRQCVQGSHCHI